MLAAGLLAALSPTAALSPAATQQTPAPHQQVLRVASATGFSTFNPFLAYFQGDLRHRRQHLPLAHQART